jgi:DNA-binding GntR family transcriptional regulator
MELAQSVEPAGRIAETSTMARQIYSDMEANILDGSWPPETKMSLRKLAKSLNTSMQPVREAVGRLVSASALEITRSRSIRVPRLSREQADEIWGLRLLLEGEAAARFAARNRPDEARRLYRHTLALREHFRDRDVRASMRRIMEWNCDLTDGSGSPILVEMVMRLRLRYAPFIAETLAMNVPDDKEFLQFTLHIQDELVLAIEEGDSAAARHLRCSDLRSFQRYLYSRRGWTP